MIELYCGKDDFLSLREVKRKIQILKADINDIVPMYLEAEEKTSQDIINAMISEDMFIKNKLLIIKRLSKNKEKDDIIDFLKENQSLIPKSTNIIFWEDFKIASNTKYYKLFKQVYVSDEMNKPAFVKWAKNEFRMNEIAIDATALNTLCVRVDYRTERLIQEIEKYKLSGVNSLDEERVIQDTTDTLQEQVWSLTKAINTNDKKNVFSSLERLLKQGTDINFIISMIARNIRLCTQVKYLSEKGQNQSQICSTLKVPPFAFFELINSAKATDWEKITYLYEKLSSLDFEIKRGNIDPESGLLLILNKA